MFSHDKILQALDHYLLALRHTHHATLAIEQFDTISNHGVAVVILRRQRVETSPCAQVAPSEFSRHHIGYLGLFHHGIVDRYLRTRCIQLIHHSLFAYREKCGSQTVHNGADLGLVLSKFGNDGAGLPEEHSRIPSEIARFEILLSGLEVRFLAETGYLVDRTHQCCHRRSATPLAATACALHLEGRIGLTLALLDVAVARLRTGRLHTQREDALSSLHKIDTLGNDATELSYIGNDMVRSSHDDCSLGIFGKNLPTHICHTGSRVAHTRFQKYMLRIDALQLVGHKLGEVLRSNDPDMLHINQALETIVGLLYHRAACPHNVKELLWTLRRRHRPEAAADATCHNN